MVLDCLRVVVDVFEVVVGGFRSFRVLVTTRVTCSELGPPVFWDRHSKDLSRRLEIKY